MPLQDGIIGTNAVYLPSLWRQNPQDEPCGVSDTKGRGEGVGRGAREGDARCQAWRAMLTLGRILECAAEALGVLELHLGQPEHKKDDVAAHYSNWQWEEWRSDAGWRPRLGFGL